ncbi:MAG: ATP-binding protein [Bacteroidota bacterium]|nr:ATP-binding protein [Bacteroidota bacterium]
MSEFKENNVLTFQIAPGSKLVFVLEEADIAFPISIAGGDNGKINIIGSKVEYTPNAGFSGVEKLVCEHTQKGKKIRTTVHVKVGYTFRAKSHILSLLGDELIGSDNLAVFELVKNAYDADAEEVTITLNDFNTPNQSITVEDDGTGMTLDTLKDVWLEIGTDSKRGEKRKPSDKFGRISLGEKGVGRLAVHKLGKAITLETQTAGSKTSSRISLNWQKVIEESEYIQDASVEIQTIQKSLFKKGKGTRIIISDLKKEVWSRKDLRDLARKTNSIKSPFRKIDHFDVVIKANDNHQEWFEDVKSIDELLKNSLYYFDFNIVEDPKSDFAKITWNYKFNPPESFGIKKRQDSLDDKKTQHKNIFSIKENIELFGKDQKNLKNKDLTGIGNVTGKFYVYNLLGPVLNAFGQTNAIRSFVKENSGIRIFRDGIRVYNYGEPNDDWLGLDLARVQKLGEHFSKNTVIGAVELELKNSQGLKEKTNREGFDENDFYLKFKTICSEVFDLFERTALSDRDSIKAYLEGIKPVKNIGLSETISELEEKLKEKKLDKELKPLLKRVEKDYNDMRDVMLNSGMTGINLGIVFHEVDREVRFINADLKNNVEINSIKIRMKNLIQLLENFSPILKQNKNIKLSASQLIERAKQINNPRFGYHNVIFSSPLISKENEDFQISGLGNLLISAISNLIDNSIYWVSDKKEILGNDGSYKPAIYIGSDLTSFSGPAIIIADNGNGFNLSPEDLVLPYRSTRPGGMGLGLYFVNMVMEMMGGKLLFPDKKETNLPKVYDGAILALVFPKK